MKTFYKHNRKPKYHIVLIFNNGEDKLIVYKYYSYYKHRWFYFTEYKELFDYCFENGFYNWKLK